MVNFTINPKSIYPVDGFDSPYQLIDSGTNSDGFYQIVDAFALQVITEGDKRLGKIISLFRCSETFMRNSFNQTPQENLLDLLIIGTLWNVYKGRWGRCIKVKTNLLKKLHHIRRSQPRLKPFVDNLRGKLSQGLLNNPSVSMTPITLSNLRLLCLWLSATNEFNEEVLRIQSWISFLESIPEETVSNALYEAVILAHWFKENARLKLGKFTSGVAPFLNNHDEIYKGKEDYFYTGRNETEYHLNMIGAAIMNQSLRNDFLETEHQVLLLPSCMAKSNSCKAVEVMHGYACANCTSGFNISTATKTMKTHGVQTFIVHHSSGFSEYLKLWSNQNKIGLIGTACTLNLLMGGFEMKRLNIPAQCVILDYSGCKKHWNTKGVPASINLNQVKKVVDFSKSKAV